MDLVGLKRDIDAGHTDKQLWDDRPREMFKFHKAAAEYRRVSALPRNHEMEIIVIWGPTGVGKTRLAWNTWPSAFSAPHKGWFDGYAGEETVIIDEMYGHRYAWSFLLQLLDRYPLLVPYKGGFHQFNSRRIVMTSNEHPRKWYDEEKVHCTWENSPLRRRINRLIHMTEIHKGLALSLEDVERLASNAADIGDEVMPVPAGPGIARSSQMVPLDQLPVEELATPFIHGITCLCEECMAFADEASTSGSSFASLDAVDLGILDQIEEE